MSMKWQFYAKVCPGKLLTIIFESGFSVGSLSFPLLHLCLRSLMKHVNTANTYLPEQLLSELYNGQAFVPKSLHDYQEIITTSNNKYGKSGYNHTSKVSIQSCEKGLLLRLSFHSTYSLFLILISSTSCFWEELPLSSLTCMPDACSSTIQYN